MRRYGFARSMRIAVFAVLALSAAPVFACGCRFGPAKDALDKSSHAFLADVVSAVPDNRDGDWMVFGIADAIVRKGGPLPFDSVRTPAGSAACGASLLVPGKYWFFTDEDGRFFSCGGAVDALDSAVKELTQSVLPQIIEQKREQAQRIREALPAR
jgi:hypothetical protein